LSVGAAVAEAAPRSCGTLSAEVRSHTVAVSAIRTRCRVARPTAINVSCSEARQVTSAWARACGRRRSCTVAGWRCERPKGNGPFRRCRRGHLGVDIWRQVLVFD
jgi:hypothetical protein